MQLKVVSTAVTEPVDNDDVKSYMGYPGNTQDDTIDIMITAARTWLEQRTALSLVAKSYKAYYEQYDEEDGWYELPVSPVLDTPAIIVKMNGVVTTYQQKGMTKIWFRPDSVIGTLNVMTSTPSYLTAEFDAGASNDIANQLIIELVTFNFNYREGGIGVSYARLPYDIQQRINAITMNF